LRRKLRSSYLTVDQSSGPSAALSSPVQKGTPGRPRGPSWARCGVPGRVAPGYGDCSGRSPRSFVVSVAAFPTFAVLPKHRRTLRALAGRSGPRLLPTLGGAQSSSSSGSSSSPPHPVPAKSDDANATKHGWKKPRRLRSGIQLYSPKPNPPLFVCSPIPPPVSEPSSRTAARYQHNHLGVRRRMTAWALTSTAGCNEVDPVALLFE